MSQKQDQTILITGASGFIATHTVNDFLRAGYHIHGTVHTSAKAGLDVSKPGAFDQAVQGVQGVFHTATPFQIFGVEDNERDLLRPAIEGTENILKAVLNFAPGVNRVVLTSSFAAMMDVIAAAKDAPAVLGYSSAKALAERAAWDFVNNEKPNFDIATIMPAIVYGPNINATVNLAKLNTPSSDNYRLMSPQSRPSDEVPQNMFWSFVDVRDVAVPRLRAYEDPEAGGERFFLCKGTFTYQQFVDALRERFPEIRDRVPIGDPGTGAVPSDVYTIKNTKSQKVLGIQYHSLEDTVVDAARSLLKLEGKSFR